MASILIIDDEEALLRSIALTLTRVGHQCTTAETAREGMRLLGDGPDLVLLDLHLPDRNGLDVLRTIRASDTETPIVVITAYASVKGAVDAIRAGAQDYVEKPLDLEKLHLVVERCLETTRLKGRLAGFERAQEDASKVEIIVRDESMRRVVEMADRIAAPDVSAATDLPTVLLLGDTGTGKGLLARYIHSRSLCANQPFVQINCAAVPATLFESELFGHEKGAFTDAKSDRQGLLEAAREGTLFLDEIGEMPVELQSKLVVSLEKKRFRRVGGTRERAMKARIIAATNSDLDEAIREGRFRADLYYRLQVFTIRLPALRERREELFALADHFMVKFARKYRKELPVLSPESRECMRRYPWPGNVRELEHVLERAVLLCHSSQIEPSELGISQTRRDSGGPLFGAGDADGKGIGPFDLADPRCTLDGVERTMIEEALRLAGGNVSEASRLLGIGRGSFRRKMDRHHVSVSTDVLHVRDVSGTE